jgi:class 3 adenylate cyclase
VRGAPHGTVTFLFTDIGGSTRLWERWPDAMRSVSAAHDRVLRAAIEAHGGYVFSTAGDAFAVAFWTPEEAARAALAAQRDVAREPWPEPVEVRVRMGLHTGTADERDGDYFGPAVNRAARIMGAGHGGQVLMFLATEELVRDRLGTASPLPAWASTRSPGSGAASGCSSCRHPAWRRDSRRGGRPGRSSATARSSPRCRPIRPAGS